MKSNLLHFFRVRRQLRTAELSASGDQWAIFLYKNSVTNPEKPWEGLFRNELLVMVRIGNKYLRGAFSSFITQAYKHIFTSPSSVESETKATRSGNARIHGMTSITMASLAYVATQVCWPFDLAAN